MAQIEKSEESGPQLFFDFTWNYVPKLFLGPPRAEKMTFSQKTGRVWFGDTYFLNPWCLPVNLPYWAPLGTSLKLFCSSRPMCLCNEQDLWSFNYPDRDPEHDSWLSDLSQAWTSRTLRSMEAFMRLHKVWEEAWNRFDQLTGIWDGSTKCALGKPSKKKKKKVWQIFCDR